MPIEPGELLRALLDAAIASARPGRCVPRHLPPPPPGRTLVVGAGKAAAAMAQAIERHWTGPLSGLVVTRYGHRVPCERIEVVEAAHPLPDGAGMEAAALMLDRVRGLSPEDLVLCAFSGGGSALLPLPLSGIGLEDKQAIGRALLACGASIGEINCVRRHLSAIKGGRLAAAAYPARLVNLLISDVPGDDPIDIASGPTVGDPTDCLQALAILDRYRIEVPAPVRHLLASGAGESVKPWDPRLAGVETRLIATPQGALEAAATLARGLGIEAHCLSDRIEGESREVAKALAAIAISVTRGRGPFATPCVILSGGETTVRLEGHGRGGPNAEHQLALAMALRGESGVHAIAADTDGVDGSEEIAGALVSPDTLERARALGLDPAAALAGNDSHGFFRALGDSVVTGPTLTNVNDFRAILVLGPGAGSAPVA